MAEPTNLKVDDLSFEGIKDNLKNFLKTKDQFLDVNFDASGISILLDILAYNTYYNSAYLNLASSEAFLPTAQKRNSVVNIARNLNYTPRSTSSARIVGTITATSTVAGPGILNFPKNTKFETTVDGQTYEFVTAEPVLLESTGGFVYTKEDVELIQGDFVSERYVYNSSDKNQRFLISNELVDTSTLTVRVLNSTVDSTTRIFTKVNNLVEIDGESLVYFLEEVEDGKYEVFFGDDFIGKALTNGNIVYLEYLVSSGKSGNDISELNYASTVNNITAVEFEANDPSFGGDDRESIEKIKFSAPKSFQAQNRAVTREDYTTLLLQQQNVEAVSVWGGEDNDPPAYGKVFISVKPVNGETLTQVEKNNLIRSVINQKRVLTVAAEIVNPTYIYLILDVLVKYDADSTSLTTSSLESIVIDTINKYNVDDINTFSKYFRYSKLTRLIDTSEKSILNNIINLRLRREIDVQLGTRARYEINFANPINPATAGRPANHPYAVGNQLTSNEFSFGGFTNCFLEDNNGIVRIYRVVGRENVGVSLNAGSIDYTTGKIILPNFAPTAFADGGTTLKLTIVPRDRDILPLRNQILTIRDEDISIQIVDDKTISLVNR